MQQSRVFENIGKYWKISTNTGMCQSIPENTHLNITTSWLFIGVPLKNSQPIILQYFCLVYGWFIFSLLTFMQLKNSKNHGKRFNRLHNLFTFVCKQIRCCVLLCSCNGDAMLWTVVKSISTSMLTFMHFNVGTTVEPTVVRHWTKLCKTYYFNANIYNLIKKVHYIR